MEQKQKDIEEKKIKVEADLAVAKPALEAAKHSVENIDQAALTTIRTYANPPEKVAFVMGAIYYMAKKDLKAEDYKNAPTWATIRALMQGNFVSTILSLKTSDIPEKAKDHVLKNYLKNPMWEI